MSIGSTSAEVDQAWELLAAVLGQDRAAFDETIERAGYVEWQSRRADAIALMAVVGTRACGRGPRWRRWRPDESERRAIIDALLASIWGEVLNVGLAEHCLAIAYCDATKLAPPTMPNLTTSVVVCAQLMQLHVSPHLWRRHYKIVAGTARRRIGTKSTYRFS